VHLQGLSWGLLLLGKCLAALQGQALSPLRRRSASSHHARKPPQQLLLLLLQLQLVLQCKGIAAAMLRLRRRVRHYSGCTRAQHSTACSCQQDPQHTRQLTGTADAAAQGVQAPAWRIQQVPVVPHSSSSSRR
jgi:hypothetical protein